MIELIQGHALDALERIAADSMYDAVITAEGRLPAERGQPVPAQRPESH